MQRERFVLLLATALTAMLIGIGLSRESQAVYGDPRFDATQPQVTNRLVHNAPGYSPSEEYIVTNPDNTLPWFLGQTTQAVTDWNNALRNPPNSLTKYPLHYNAVGDPGATIIITYVSDAEFTLHCTGGGACNDVGYPTTHIWVKSSNASKALVTHEIGHSLWYTDQYGAGFSCSV